MDINTILLTKDGRRVGNGIVTGVTNINSENLYFIKTDYGNNIQVKESDIDAYFYVGSVARSDHKNFTTSVLKSLLKP